MKHFEKNQKLLLTVHILRTVLELFTSTFLTSHILSVNADDILGKGLLNIGLFYISFYISYALFYLIASKFVDKSNRVTFLRIGIFINTCFLVALVFWGTVISSWIVFAGLIYGISDAVYYSCYLVMRNEYSPRTSMKDYNILSVILINIVKIIVPTILGFLIDVSSFSMVALYVVAITIVQFVITFFFNASKPQNSAFELKKFLKYLRKNKDAFSKVKFTYLNALVAGFKSTYSVIVIILTVYTFKTNLSLGIFTSLFSLVTIFLLMLYKKIDNSPKVNKLAIYLILGIMPVIGCTVMVVWMNKITLVIYNFILTIAIYFSEYFGNIERDAIIKHLGKKEFIAEHQFVCEAVQCTTRCVAYGILMLVGLFASITAFKILLICYMLINPFKFVVMYNQRKVRKSFENEQLEQQAEQIPAVQQ
ncbi:MAG: MFS transporter [Clostridia bacterium]|nr:MFS transporter [Clostridia bacterium]